MEVPEYRVLRPFSIWNVPVPAETILGISGPFGKDLVGRGVLMHEDAYQKARAETKARKAAKTMIKLEKNPDAPKFEPKEIKIEKKGRK